MTVWKKGLNPWTEARVHLHCWLSASNSPRIYRRLFAGPLYGREAGVESQKMIWNWYKCVFLILSLTRLQWLLLLEVEVHIVLQQRWFIEVGIWYIYIYISTHSRFYTFNLTMTCIPIKCRSLCVQPAASFSGRLVLIQTYGLRESPNALGTVTERRPCLKLLHSDRAVIQENAAPHHVTVVAPSPFGLPELVGLSPAAVLGNFLRLPQLGGSVEHTMIPYNSQ
jgi:hypothetical protein